MDTSLDSALGAQRQALLTKLSATAAATEQQRARQFAGGIGDQAHNARDINTASLPVDPARGRNLNITA